LFMARIRRIMAAVWSLKKICHAGPAIKISACRLAQLTENASGQLQ